nr:MAG TPA: hypothetical protein [Caudoviricetes sp.]
MYHFPGSGKMVHPQKVPLVCSPSPWKALK